MKYNLHFKCVLLVLLMLMNGSASFAQNAEPLTKQGVFWIKMKPELSEQVKELKSTDGSPIEVGIYPMDNLAATYGATQMKRLFRYDPKFEHKLQKHGLHLWYEVSYSGRADVMTVTNQYKELSEVEMAEPVYEASLIGGEPRYLSEEDVATLLSTNRSENMPFNDPYLPMQWHYNNTGQTGGYEGADINLFEAWNTSVGSSEVIVAIHDQGVDWDHEDLHANMWVNEAELNGEEFVDDDGNGWKDDVYGFNFAENKGAVTPDYHGTHVAGTVGAMNNNRIGVSGVAGGDENTPGVKMMTLQLFGGVSTGNTPESYVYAANNGAVISQNSWGYSTPGYVNQATLDAIDYFIEEAGDYAGSPMKGGIVIFASGNNASDIDHWPAAYENVISVSSLDAKRGKASYSNYHETVDISAPGGESGDDAFMPEGQEDDGYSNGVLSTFNSNAYGYLDGTSMACPHVSGIAALILSEYGGVGFTPEKLRTHLLTGVVNIDTVPENEPYIGRLGRGISDAVLSLVEDTEIGPLATSDLSVVGVTQEFIKLEWTVPADEHDGLAASYEILYAEQPITEATLEFAKIRTMSNDKKLGEVVGFEVPELKALTDYYFRIRSLDRWGNRSEFSNEVMATTNSGPDAWIDKSDFIMHAEYVNWTEEEGDIYDTVYYMPINIDAHVEIEGSNSFNLHNDGEGLLRWEVLQRHVESIDANTVSTPNYLRNNPDVNFSTAKLQVCNAPFYGKMELFAQEEIREGMSYIDPYGARYYYIGETDTSYTNSSATRFTVEYEEGFNLTHAEFFLNYEGTKEKPAIFQVFSGWDISEAKLMYSEEISNTQENWNLINLKEQIFFNNGEHFWLVIHIPSGNLYPLGASVELEKEDSENCYISLNMGKSWALFEDMYYDNSIIWATNAVSLLKTPGEYLTITPSEGELLTGEFTPIEVGLDASEVINGTYKANVVVETNQTEEPQLRAQTWVEVSGQQPIIKGEPIVDFGSVIYGKQKVMEVTLRNEGYGKFHKPTFSFSNADGIFDLVGSTTTINPLSEYTFQIVFNPKEYGNSSSKVTLSNTNGQQYVFNVIGVCAEPPVMELAPDTITFEDVAIGDKLTGEFYINNTGNFPLSYYFPAFSSGETVGEVTGDFCKYGYTYNDNHGGSYELPEYNWTEISNSGTLLEDYSRERTHFYYPVELGFDFPFFGKQESKVYITNFGLLSFDTNSVFSSSPIYFKHSSTQDRFISALGKWHDLNFWGKIYYQDFGDKFIVQYDKVNYGYYDKTAWKWIDALITYQIVLYPNGNIEFHYKDFASLPQEDVTMWSFFGIEDKTTDDGLLISQQYSENLAIGNEMCIRITNPGLGLVTEISNPEGVVQAGESLKINFNVSTDILNVGNHVENIPILTNDPFNNPGIVSLDINVTSGGAPDLIISNEEFDYGQVFQTDVIENILWVVNEGRANDTIKSVTFANDLFTVSGDIPVGLAPKRKVKYNIAVKSDILGLKEDVMTITTHSGREFNINLSAEIIEAPQINSDIISITQTLGDQEEAVHLINITNNGGNNLELAPIGNDWLTVSEASVLANDVSEFTYTWTRSEDEGGPTYIWEEINETGTFVGVLDAWENLGPAWTEAVELPFDFNYYGQNYNKVYLGANGVLTFTETDVAEAFGANGVFPAPLEPNNVVAPMWGFIYPTWWEEGAGVYYHKNEDRVIIEWYKYIDGFYMSYPISFQVILYPDGNIKFQYNMADIPGESLTSFSGIGLENADGTDGITVGWGTYGIVKDRTALLFAPLEKIIIEPGQTKSLELLLSAKNIYAGDYHHDLVLYNNTPDAGEYAISVDLTVTGEAAPEYPAELDFGVVQAYGHEFIKEFEIFNAGNKALGISKFNLANVKNAEVEAWVPMAFGLGDETQMMWVDVKELNPTILWINQMVQPNEGLKMRVKIAPTTADVINDVLLLQNDLESGEDLSISINAAPELPPVLGLKQERIDIFAPTTDYTEDFSFKLGNVEGHSGLDYELDIRFIRELPEVQSTTSAILKNTTSSVPLLAQDAEINKKLKNTSVDEYNRVLQYENAEQPEKALGYGGGMIFHSATRFQAPKDGFNLTHVKTWYTPGEWLESDIVVKVYTGDRMIQNCQEVYSQKFQHIIDATDVHGSFITIELDESQLFFPEEYFFIVMQFPIGAEYPQGAAVVDEQSEGRFMFGEGENWFDIIDAGFADWGWMTKACESEFKVAVWAEIVTELSGEVAEGVELDVNMKFAANYADYGVNKAEMTILTNDPYKTRTVIPVTLNKNQGPIFNLGKETFVSVKEGEVLSLDVLAADAEGDGFTIRMADIYEDVKATFADGVLNFELTTNYESAGIHKYEVIGEDAYGNPSSFTITVDVINVNRAPQVAAPIESLMITLPQDSIATIDLNEMFTDPDGDMLQFEVLAELPDGFETFISEDKVIFGSSTIGSLPVTIKAFDYNEAMVVTTFDLVARMRTGIDDNDLTNGLTVYPNPVETSTTVSWSEINISKESIIKVIDISGAVVMTEIVGNTYHMSQMKLNMSKLEPGVYFIELSVGEETMVTKVIKK
ncbi:S8 family serine peptidase [Carboxylicivirga sp. RSCT41]|uniref:S8 family serine peptidase n=1 Tax=Carboxylicivirga agarovorans TaxID=3417570 RepID=UPI003D327FF9